MILSVEKTMVTEVINELKSALDLILFRNLATVV